MYVDFDNRLSEEYPEGAYCLCGRCFHFKIEDLHAGNNYFTCPKCGYEICYIKFLPNIVEAQG